MVLQGTGHDLGGRGGAVVDQHHQRQSAGQVARPRAIALDLVGLAPALADDLAAFQEGVRHGDGRIQQAAAVVPQVQHIALDGGVLALQPGDGLAQFAAGILVEGRDAQIGEVALDPPGNGIDPDHFARQRHLARILAVAQEGDLDCRADRPAQFFGHLADGQAGGALALNGGDDISGIDAGAGGRPAVHRRDHLHQAALGLDGQAHARIGPRRALLQLVIATGRQVVGMGVQRPHHALQRGLDQFLVIDRDDIGLFDDAQDVPEQGQHPESLVPRRLACGGRCAEPHEGHGGSANQQQFTHRVSFSEQEGGSWRDQLRTDRRRNRGRSAITG